jgi:CRISPR-associated protein Cas2
VIYDIEDDGIRLRVASTCRDYGLAHIQYSAFSGPLSSTLRNELCRKLRDVLGKAAGRVLVAPLCDKDAAAAREMTNPPSWLRGSEDAGS